MILRLVLAAPIAFFALLVFGSEMGAHLTSIGTARTLHELLWDNPVIDICPIRRVMPGEPVPPSLATSRIESGPRVEILLPDASAERDLELRGLAEIPRQDLDLEFYSD